MHLRALLFGLLLLEATAFPFGNGDGDGDGDGDGTSESSSSSLTPCSGSSCSLSHFKPRTTYPTVISTPAAPGSSHSGSFPSQTSIPATSASRTPTSALPGSDSSSSLFTPGQTGSSPPETSSGSGGSSSSTVLPIISITSLSTSSVSTVTGVTSNTIIQTTDDHGHHTAVPFLWHCWFCGGGGLFAWGIGMLYHSISV